MGKVLIYTLTEGIGGVEEYIMNLSRYIEDPQSKFGYLIIGEKCIYEPELKKKGIDYYYIPPKKKLYSNFKRYKELLKKLRDKYDTIYFNTSGLYYPVPYLFATKYNYKIVLHSHSTSGSWPKSIIHKINRKWINKMISLKLACSTPAGEWMFGKKQFKIIPNAIELERFLFDLEKRLEYRSKYAIEDKFVIGNIARLTYVKNQSYLLQIFYEYKKNHDNSVLMLVGDGEDTDKLKKLVSDMNIDDAVIFVGRTDTPEYYLSTMDCFVMPSIVEGFPITLVEAQANGVPCVVSDTITPEVNISGNIGFCSIGSAAKDWCEKIDEYTLRYECYEKLKEAGYDVKDIEKRVYALIKSD